MRLFLLPVSTRRTMMYAQRLAATATKTTGRTSAAAAAAAGTKTETGTETGTTAGPSYADSGAAWAARTWAQWEKKPSGWQRKVVDYGNRAFRRIPFEEWGLKSVPPLSARRRDLEPGAGDRVELVFPGAAMTAADAEALARRLATERQGLHRKRIMWCLVGMPATLPFVLIPVVPNLPFFYLVYRAWSHWRAISGGRHVEWLVDNKLLVPSPSTTLDGLYAHRPAAEPSGKEEMLLTRHQVRSFCDALQLPALEIELERAIWQVERALREDRPDETKAKQDRQ